MRRGPDATLSLRARISLLAALAVALAVAATTAGIYLTVRAQLYDQLDADLLGRARAAVGGSLSNPEQLVFIPADALGDARAGLLTSDGSLYLPRGGEAPPIDDSERAVAQGRTDQSVRGVSQEGHDLRVVAVPAGGGTALVLAASTDSVQATLTYVGLVSLIIGLLGVAAAATAGYGVARAGLAPLRDLTDAAEHIADTTDLTPIAEGCDDEIGRLARSFNAMLASLAAARGRERQLVADAGHELRTPLTSLRTNLDLLAQADAAGRALTPVDRSALLSDVREQVQELAVLVDDLVELSRGPESRPSSVQLDLRDVVNDALTRVRRRAHDVTFEAETASWPMVGDPQSLERAVTNLLDNAARWSPPGGTVDVRLSQGTLTVDDQGPGIDPADRPHVFKRFYRAEGARGTPGSGLGLAIVAQAVAQHGGTVAVGDSPAGGARFEVRLVR
jgi:two-component system, OmpR family, sensor histidine kinase MprB